MKEKNKGKSLFWRLYIIIFGFLILLICGALFYLWNYLDEYEKSLPTKLLANVTEDLKNSDSSNIKDLFEISGSEFEDSENYKEFIVNFLKGKKISLSEKSGSNKGAYTIRVDNKNFATLHLAEVDMKSKYGLKKHRVEKISDFKLSEKSFIITAAETDKVTINGVELTDKDVIKTGTVNENLTALEEIIEIMPLEIPKLKQYKVENLINTPKVEGKDFNNNPCEILIDENTGEITVLPKQNNNDIEKFSKLVSDNAILYTEYTTNDKGFHELSPKLIKDTKLYKSLRTMEVMWYTPHDSYEFKNMKTYNLLMYSDDIFSCDIEFDHYVYRNSVGKTFHYETALRFYYVKVDGEWLIASMVIKEAKE